jgi:hypothetical protein
MAIRPILRAFVKINGIWYIFWLAGIFSSVLVSFTEKNLATLDPACKLPTLSLKDRPRQKSGMASKRFPFFVDKFAPLGRTKLTRKGGNGDGSIKWLCTCNFNTMYISFTTNYP